MAWDEYEGMNNVLAHVEALGRLSMSPEDLTTTNGAGGRFRPVTKRKKRLLSSQLNCAKAAHRCLTQSDASFNSSPYLPENRGLLLKGDLLMYELCMYVCM